MSIKIENGKWIETTQRSKRGEIYAVTEDRFTTYDDSWKKIRQKAKDQYCQSCKTTYEIGQGIWLIFMKGDLGNKHVCKKCADEIRPQIVEVL